MAATRPIEVERGTFTGFVRSHNGYYAGDFSRRGEGRPAGRPFPVVSEPGVDRGRLTRPAPR